MKLYKCFTLLKYETFVSFLARHFYTILNHLSKNCYRALFKTFSLFCCLPVFMFVFCMSGRLIFYLPVSLFVNRYFNVNM